MESNKPKGFSYKRTKDNKIFISRFNKIIMVVKGIRASELLAELDGSSEDEINYILAIETGQYKHGNEKTAVWARSRKEQFS